METQSTAERIQLIKEQTKRLRSIYASGKPFYPLDAFKDLARQVDSMNLAVKEGGIHSSIDKGGRPKCLPKFTTLNIFGEKVDKKVRIHSVLGTAESWKSTIPTVTIPFYSIHYNSYPTILRELTFCERDGTPVHSAYLCSLQVQWWEQARDPRTNQVVPPFEVWPLEDVQEAFEAGIKEWEATEACQRLRAAVQSAAIASTVTKIGMYFGVKDNIAPETPETLDMVEVCLSLDVLPIHTLARTSLPKVLTSSTDGRLWHNHLQGGHSRASPVTFGVTDFGIETTTLERFTPTYCVPCHFWPGRLYSPSPVQRTY